MTVDEIVCEHFDNGECKIASGIAGLPVFFDRRACTACVKQEQPQSVNKVTTDIASYALLLEGREAEAVDIIRNRQPPRPLPEGVGKSFAEAYPWLDIAGCDCRGYLMVMNEWGASKCIGKRDTLAGWFADVADRLGVDVTKDELSQAILAVCQQYESENA